MRQLDLLPEAEATDKVEQFYGRIKDLLGTPTVPEPFLLYGRVPSFLQDFFMNAKKYLFADGKLTEKQKALLALSLAASQKSSLWTEFFTERCQALGWSGQETTDALAVAGTCAMYNMFFKFRDLAGKSDFEAMPVGLRAHTFGGTSLDDATVELINIVISDMNSCHACVSGHVKKALDLGVSEEGILEAVQAAATLQAGITFLTSAGR